MKSNKFTNDIEPIYVSLQNRRLHAHRRYHETLGSSSRERGLLLGNLFNAGLTVSHHCKSMHAAHAHHTHTHTEREREREKERERERESVCVCVCVCRNKTKPSQSLSSFCLAGNGSTHTHTHMHTHTETESHSQRAPLGRSTSPREFLHTCSVQQKRISRLLWEPCYTILSDC